jgi:hypothetical protein
MIQLQVNKIVHLAIGPSRRKVDLWVAIVAAAAAVVGSMAALATVVLMLVSLDRSDSPSVSICVVVAPAEVFHHYGRGEGPPQTLVVVCDGRRYSMTWKSRGRSRR